MTNEPGMAEPALLLPCNSGISIHSRFSPQELIFIEEKGLPKLSSKVQNWHFFCHQIMLLRYLSHIVQLEPTDVRSVGQMSSTCFCMVFIGLCTIRDAKGKQAAAESYPEEPVYQ